jgi:hypothetical protein
VNEEEDDKAYSNQYLAAEPFGLTCPLMTAEELVTLDAVPVKTEGTDGAGADEVVKVLVLP